MRRIAMVLILSLAAAMPGWAMPRSLASGAWQPTVPPTRADFNGDVFRDLGVGVPGEAVGTAGGAGSVNVLYGTATGLAVAGAQLFSQGADEVAGSAESSDGFGSALAAGDLDGDGFADLAVGVPGEDVGSVEDAGAVVVLYGTVDGLVGTGSQLFTQDSGGVPGVVEAGDLFGSALAVGDFDRDSDADLAVGVAGEDVDGAAEAGAVNVLYGKGAGLDGVGADVFTQGADGLGGVAESSDGFGSTLAAGDFDIDAATDLAVGVPLEDVSGAADAGAVNVLYGAEAAGLTGTGNQLFTQGAGGAAGSLESDDQFGQALAVANFNQQSGDDLAVGVPSEDRNTVLGGIVADAGAVSVLYGSLDGLSDAGSQLFTQGSADVLDRPEDSDQFGQALAAGHFDLSHQDLAVGVPSEDGGTAADTLADAGAINVLDGSDDGLTGEFSQLFTQGPGGAAGSLESNDQFGQALATLDFDGPADAVSLVDLAVGVPSEDVGDAEDAGAVNVLLSVAFTGLTDAGSQLFTQDTPGVPGAAETGDLFGSALASG